MAIQPSTGGTSNSHTLSQQEINEFTSKNAQWKSVKRFSREPVGGKMGAVSATPYLCYMQALGNGAFASVCPVWTTLPNTQNPAATDLVFRRAYQGSRWKTAQSEYFCWSVVKDAPSPYREHLPIVSEVRLKPWPNNLGIVSLIMKKYPTNLTLELQELHKAYKEAIGRNDVQTAKTIEKKLYYIAWTLCKSLEAFEIVTQEKNETLNPKGACFIHRDLKPDNIVLDRDLTAKVIDFGLAIASPCAPEKCGTPQYMSPECWNDNCGDLADDIWALGGILFEIFDPLLDNARSLYQQKVKTRRLAFAAGNEPCSIQLFLNQEDTPQKSRFVKEVCDLEHKQQVDLHKTYPTLHPAPPPQPDYSLVINDDLFALIFRIATYKREFRPGIQDVIARLENFIKNRLQMSEFAQFLHEAGSFCALSHFPEKLQNLPTSKKPPKPIVYTLPPITAYSSFPSAIPQLAPKAPALSPPCAAFLSSYPLLPTTTTTPTPSSNHAVSFHPWSCTPSTPSVPLPSFSQEKARIKELEEQLAKEEKQQKKLASNLEESEKQCQTLDEDLYSKALSSEQQLHEEQEKYTQSLSHQSVLEAQLGKMTQELATLQAQLAQINSTADEPLLRIQKQQTQLQAQKQRLEAATREREDLEAQLANEKGKILQFERAIEDTFKALLTNDPSITTGEGFSSTGVQTSTPQTPPVTTVTTPPAPALPPQEKGGFFGFGRRK